MVRWGDNKAVRYLEVVVYAEGSRKGIIWLLEGREGRGRCCFVRELRQMLVPFQTSLSCRVLLKFQRFFVWGSFAEVVRATTSSTVDSGGHIDLF
jgi:hypothetical protein